MNAHVFKVCLFNLVNAINVKSAQLRLACDSLQQVNNNYDNNKDDVRIA